MPHITPFCPHCGAYAPAASCPACRRTRSLLDTPRPAGEALWTRELGVRPALRLGLAHVGGRTLLLVPYSDAGAGGVFALDAATGHTAWTAALDMPVEGGVAVAARAGLAVVGLAGSGFDRRGAVVALGLATGELRWRADIPAAVEGAPAVDDARVYVAAADGMLYCLDLRDGRPVRPWPKPLPGAPCRVPAAPALRLKDGIAQLIVVATYETARSGEAGRLVAFDYTGAQHLDVPLTGIARGAPALTERAAVVAVAERSRTRGSVAAFDLGTGTGLWQQPFAAPPDHKGHSEIQSAPLVVGDTVYVTSRNGRLHALNLQTGAERWHYAAGRGSLCAPTFSDGLIVFGSNGGRVFAVDAATGELAWQHAVGEHVQAAVVAWDDVLFAAASDGRVAALPWCGGQYGWAAARFEAQGRWVEAGAMRALDGHFGARPAEKEAAYEAAERAWDDACAPELAGAMWYGLGGRYRRRAADAYRRAGLSACDTDKSRAAVAMRNAAALYYEIYATEPLSDATHTLVRLLNECGLALAECAGLPHLAARLENCDSLAQWEESTLSLRLMNDGAAATVGRVSVTVKGLFAAPVAAAYADTLPRGGYWQINLRVCPTQTAGVLEVEVEYAGGEPGPLRTVLIQSIRAAVRQRPPTFNFGDVTSLKLEVATGSDGQRIEVVTGDVMLLSARGARVGS